MGGEESMLRCLSQVLAGVVSVGLAGALIGANCTPQTSDEPLVGDTARGAELFAQGDGVGPACQSCHCPDASGGCRLSAPNIQGRPYDLIDARTRDPEVSHPGGKFSFTNQDIADIEAFLASLTNE
jgi:mono/diheme cytochrome c family protein